MSGSGSTTTQLKGSMSFGQLGRSPDINKLPIVMESVIYHDVDFTDAINDAIGGHIVSYRGITDAARMLHYPYSMSYIYRVNEKISYKMTPTRIKMSAESDAYIKKGDTISIQIDSSTLSDGGIRYVGLSDGSPRKVYYSKNGVCTYVELMRELSHNRGSITLNDGSTLTIARIDGKPDIFSPSIGLGDLKLVRVNGGVTTEYDMPTVSSEATAILGQEDGASVTATGKNRYIYLDKAGELYVRDKIEFTAQNTYESYKDKYWFAIHAPFRKGTQLHHWSFHLEHIGYAESALDAETDVRPSSTPPNMTPLPISQMPGPAKGVYQRASYLPMLALYTRGGVKAEYTKKDLFVIKRAFGVDAEALQDSVKGEKYQDQIDKLNDRKTTVNNDTTLTAAEKQKIIDDIDKEIADLTEIKSSNDDAKDALDSSFLMYACPVIATPLDMPTTGKIDHKLRKKVHEGSVLGEYMFRYFLERRTIRTVEEYIDTLRISGGNLSYHVHNAQLTIESLAAYARSNIEGYTAKFGMYVEVTELPPGAIVPAEYLVESNNNKWEHFCARTRKANQPEEKTKVITVANTEFNEDKKHGAIEYPYVNYYAWRVIVDGTYRGTIGIRVYGMTATNVYEKDGKRYVQGIKSGEQNPGQTEISAKHSLMRMPLRRDILDNMNALTRRQLLAMSLSVATYHAKLYKVKDSSSGLFDIILVVVSIVIAVVFPPGGAFSFTSLMLTVGTSLLINYVVKFVAKLLGPELGAALLIIVGIMTGNFSNALNSATNLVNALTKIAGILQDAAAMYLEGKYQQLKESQTRFEEYKQKRNKELNDLIKKNEGDVDEDTRALLGHIVSESIGVQKTGDVALTHFSPDEFFWVAKGHAAYQYDIMYDQISKLKDSSRQM